MEDEKKKVEKKEKEKKKEEKKEQCLPRLQSLNVGLKNSGQKSTICQLYRLDSKLTTIRKNNLAKKI